MTEKKLPKCPNCKGSEVIWDDSTESYVCINPNCGKEWRIVKGKVKYVRWI